jgi:ferrous iron transport protein A
VKELQQKGIRMALSELAEGESAMIESLDLPDDIQNQLMHMGFMPEAAVTALRRAPAGDPTVYAIDGAEVALRRETAFWIKLAPDSLKTPERVS